MATQTKEKRASMCGPGMESCCQVEAIVALDDRGQMVLPKEVREKAGIKPGDKLAVVSCNMEGRTCCLMMMKTDELAGMVKTMMGPIAKEVFG